MLRGVCGGLTAHIILIRLLELRFICDICAYIMNKTNVRHVLFLVAGSKWTQRVARRQLIVAFAISCYLVQAVDASL